MDSIEGVLVPSGALGRISEALRGLVSGLTKSLQEFQDVESMLEVEAAAAGINRNGVDEPGRAVSVEVRRELLLDVAGTVKEMVGAWVSDIRSNAQVQKLMAAGEHHGELMNIPKHDQQSSSLGGTLVCNSSRVDSRAGKRGKGLTTLCKHSCEHHQEVVDPRVWRNLPPELVELVFAKLPLDAILGLCDVSRAWCAMSRSSSFCGLFSARFPKLFGLLGMGRVGSSYSLNTTIYDEESNKWLCYIYENWSFPMPDKAYQNSMFACDGGLVCFVPVENLASAPIVVWNPLSNTSRTLPLMPLDNVEKVIIMVQLVVDDDTKGYRVILVIRETIEQVFSFSAHFYHTKTGVWSMMDSGLVYGARKCRLATGPGAPSVFDCTTKEFQRIFDYSLPYSVVRDGMFVLHGTNISKYTWDSSKSDLRGVKRIRDVIKNHPEDTTMLLANLESVLVVSDNRAEQHLRHQQTLLLDWSTADITIPPVLTWQSVEDLKRSVACAFRWDIAP
ncbi:hypothetical protein KC19_3G211800 [Ceratodon purpureus]|uniref:F-box domain-containing protein n=1 Tax=Ceratodon purpureus TaxID=3225 RepID=A0A8T0IPW3_CERPU|nr:hypothetical protein KC19_3G211800 [Ceratodon purpureus]